MRRRTLLIGSLALTTTALHEPEAAEPEDLLVIELETGKVVIEMMPDLAPQHVQRVRELAAEGFYDGVVFHRVIPGFMAQTGDPTGTGRGGSDKPNLPAEFNQTPFKRGTVGMARAASPNSANSQFFICFAPASHLNGQYTVWGQVIEGMDLVDQIATGEPPRNPDKMVKVRVQADL
jgi:cyclophilin family peptidyl-prolyl cis-trans isomerase